MIRVISSLLLLIIMLSSCVDNDTYEDNPQGNLEALWTIMDEHYCFFEEKGVDWDAVHDKYAVQMDAQMSESQQFEVMTNMLSELRDGHVNLYTTGVGRRTIPPISATPCCENIFRLTTS